MKAPIPLVHVDPEQMREVFSNLVANALKYSPDDSQVEVVCEDRAGEVAVRVTDLGIGIPAASLPHVFDRFYRASNTRDLATTGSGLGLTITRQLVEASGGQIRAESGGEGLGSTFTVLLPSRSPDSARLDHAISEAS